MKRTASIEALLRRANDDYADLRQAYDSSLHMKHVSENLKVAIKNIFENLRSCLDYLAQDIFEIHCSNTKKPDRLYFPIRTTADEFTQVVSMDYPGLNLNAKRVFDILEAVQPYNDPWLGKFNKLNNHNKHQDLVEQTRTESRHVKVSRGDGSISWTPGVTFSPGISLMGVPIDPNTQLPVPNVVAKTEEVIWIDFQFKETNDSVLPFVQTSLEKVQRLFRDIQPLV